MVIENIPARRYMMKGQTPQAFRARVIKEAHARASRDKNVDVTDDCSLVLKYKLADIYVAPGEERNIKVTHPEDIALADKLFQLKSVKTPDDISLDRIKDKVVVVFGAGRGIGKAIVETAKAHGARAYGYSRESGTDVSSMRSVAEALKGVFQKEKRIDHVAVTAGILRMGKVETRSIEDIAEEIAINYTGSINVIKASMEYLKQSKGSIVLFTSSSYTRGRALYAIYSSMKAALVNVVQGLAEEFFNDGVRINSMNPGRTATAMRTENFGKEPEETLLKPGEVAAASLKTLLSELTGETVDVRKDDQGDR
jgi:2-C-methyl-D-erythritol 4-phosphate cytidylyltransferase